MVNHTRGYAMFRTLALFVALACVALPGADEPKWFTDLPTAVAEATKAKKPLLVDFTGSDWCGWCVKLKKEVFDTAEFKAWAAKTVVLVEIDFPRGKAQSAAEKKANQDLAEKHGIQGFPTIVLLDAAGTKKIGELGYLQGGPQAWTAEADKALAAK